ncbi:hypothetical protein B4109_1618 [Geobacillus stearothermophilus]|uniref:Uncharacterized protein n=1 Tax=Geobacillus stearothermophilus TaxID=1422 RepID=A0A150MEW2_GEOSE|nr:hypothetical protein B4109_1618 [Geobacillus stearothermophilus]
MVIKKLHFSTNTYINLIFYFYMIIMFLVKIVLYNLTKKCMLHV